MKLQIGYENVSLEKFNDDDIRCVEDCRQTVGYKPDADWVCPYLGDEAHQTKFREQFPGKYVGGFNCYCCFTKEAADWKAHGLLLQTQ